MIDDSPVPGCDTYVTSWEGGECDITMCTSSHLQHCGEDEPHPILASVSFLAIHRDQVLANESIYMLA